MQVSKLKVLCKDTKTIVLTYDDGPSEFLTVKIVKLLKEHGVRATFFVLGRNVQSNPSVLSALVEGGHEIGSHSQQHLNAWKVSPTRIWKDTKAGFKFSKGNEADVKFYRPPYGKMTIFTLVQLSLHRWQVGWWTHDSCDSAVKTKPVDMIINNIRKAGGGVVLMHDIDRTGMYKERDEFVLDLTKNLLEFATLENYRIKTLGEAFEARK